MANTIFDIPTDIWSDGHFDKQIMVHDVSQPEAFSTTLLPIGQLFTGYLDVNHRKALDSYSSPSIDWGNYELLDSGNAIVLNWGNKTLSDSYHNVVVNWQDKELKDRFGVLSLRWEERECIDYYGHFSFSWSGRYTSDQYGNLSLDWKNRQLVKADGSMAFDWQNTKLKVCQTTTLQISQLGIADPIITNVLENELIAGAITFSLTRIDAGVYRLNFNGPTLNVNKLAAFIIPNTDNTSMISCKLNSTYAIISTKDLTGALADNLLSNTPIKLEYYIPFY